MTITPTVRIVQGVAAGVAVLFGAATIVAGGRGAERSCDDTGPSA